MHPNKQTPPHQPKLGLFKNPLWAKLPESNRVCCRDLLILLLRQVVLKVVVPTDDGRPDHE